jgi:hypothetical protein
MPMFEDAMKVPTFAVPVTFAEVAITLVVQKLFEAQAFPWTLRLKPDPMANKSHSAISRNSFPAEEVETST